MVAMILQWHRAEVCCWSCTTQSGFVSQCAGDFLLLAVGVSTITKLWLGILVISNSHVLVTVHPGSFCYGVYWKWFSGFGTLIKFFWAANWAHLHQSQNKQYSAKLDFQSEANMWPHFDRYHWVTFFYHQRNFSRLSDGNMHWCMITTAAGSFWTILSKRCWILHQDFIMDRVV